MRRKSYAICYTVASYVCPAELFGDINGRMDGIALSASSKTKVLLEER
jgi:hypothetical protein